MFGVRYLHQCNTRDGLSVPIRASTVEHVDVKGYDRTGGVARKQANVAATLPTVTLRNDSPLAPNVSQMGLTSVTRDLQDQDSGAWYRVGLGTIIHCRRRGCQTDAGSCAAGVSDARNGLPWASIPAIAVMATYVGGTT